MTQDMQKLSKSAQAVQDALAAKGLDFNVVELNESTRTAQEAADTIGCTVSQIVKSLVFKTKQTNRPILVLASGTNRVNEKKVAEYIGEKIERADADFVRAVTGFAIGGVPPVGHAQKIETFIDKDLLNFDILWAAAGTPHAVFKLSGETIVQLTNGKVVSIT